MKERKDINVPLKDQGKTLTQYLADGWVRVSLLHAQPVDGKVRMVFERDKPKAKAKPKVKKVKK